MMSSRQRPLTCGDVRKAIVDPPGGLNPWALVTLLDARGSTPAGIGARAIVDAKGDIRGTIGGGALEAFTQQTAIRAIQDSRPALFDFDLKGVGPPVADPICGGQLRVLVDPRPAQHLAAFDAAARAQTGRTRGLLLTSAITPSNPGKRTGPKTGAAASAGPLISVQWLNEATLSRHSGFPDRATLRKLLQHETPGYWTAEPRARGERQDVLVEPVVPNPRLLIVGGGHVGQALALHASLVGFEITVIDDREAFARPALFPDGTETCTGQLADVLEAFPFSDDTYVALVSRGHKTDAEALAVCLRKPRAYLGMIGSRRKVALVKKDFLRSRRVSLAEWNSIHAPIGLDIAALTVPEIATSIVAQLIAIRRTGKRPARCAGGNET
jgi:xanthine dehydrogenase accessory factor